MSPVSEKASSSRCDPTETDVGSLSRVHEMTTGPRINVHTLLPDLSRAAALGGDLDFNPNNWKWTHSLTFPLETFRTLHPSQKSYKWIRFAIGVVTGTEGTLSTSPDSPDSMDYDEPSAESTDLYYHTSIQEMERMFPIDPDITRTQITSSVLTDQSSFCADVSERDREQCILTGIPSSHGLCQGLCDATHLIAHSKGNDVCNSYFQLVFTHHFNHHSTLPPTLSIAVETPLEVTSSYQLMMSEMGFF